MLNGGIVKLGRRLTIWLPESIVRQLKARAAIERRPASHIVCSAVSQYLKREEGKQA